MRSSLHILLAALLGAAAPVAQCQSYEARVHQASDGTVLPYRFLAPETVEEGARYPLVLFLHGAGERGDDNSAQLKHGTALYLERSNRTAYPCYVVVPQCPRGKQWASLPWSGLAGRQAAEPSQPMQAALALLEELSQEFAIDPDRLYVTGLSMGGYGTWDLVTRFPDRFAAAAPICGGGDEWAAARAASTPLWAFHSDDDGTVKVDRTRNMIAVVRAGDGRPHYTEYTGLGHNSWTTAYEGPEFLPWLFAQRRGQPDTYAWTESAPPVCDVTHLPETDRALAGSGPIRRYDWFEDLWRDRRQTWLKKGERDQGAVVFLGDSITQGWGDQMGNSFPGLKLANRGISGDTTRGVIIRLQEDVLALKPRGVVLLIGTNDLEEKAPPETIADNVRLILAMLKAHNPKLPVVLCRVFPSSATKSRPADQIQQINELYAELAEWQPQVTLIDTWTPFANAHGDANPEEFPDLLHPNEAGYHKWAAALKPELRRLQLLR